MSNFFGSSSTNNEASQGELGSRLYNIKQSSIGTESVLSILPDNNVVVNTCSSFGKSLLNVSTLNQLVGLINSGDSKVEVLDSTTGEINFTLDNALKLVVKNAYTEVLNELRSLNIVSATDLQYDVGSSTKRYNYGYFRRIASNSTGQVAIGDNSGTGGISSVNIGYNAGASGNPDFSVSIGRGANNGNTTGYTRSISLGYAVHQNGVANDGCIAIGFQAGQGAGTTSTNTCKANSICLGYNSAQFGLGTNAISIGANACLGSLGVAQGDYGIAIGNDAGRASIGENSIAIGRNAGITMSHNKTIILNASGVALNSDGTDRCFISPIRSSGTGNVLNYDTGSKEVLSGGNVSMQTLTSQGLNPDILNSRDIGTTSLPWNGLYCNGLIQPSASNPLSFNVNGSNRMFINSSGSLVCSTVASGASATNGGIILYNNAGNSSTRAISGGVVSNEICGLSSSGTNAGQLRLSAGGGTDASSKVYIDMFAYNNNVMIFGTQGAERMRISGANVGIGQNAPTEILDVLGNVKISSQLAIGTTVSSAYTVDVRRTGVDNYQRISGDVAKKQGLIFSDGATPTDIWTFYKKETTKTLNIYNNTTTSDLMTFTSTNQVGINCNPVASSTLEVRGSGSSSYLRIAGADSLQQALLFSDTSDRWAWYKPANTTDLRLYNYVSTNPKDLMTFTQTNLVGINTATPVYNLHLNVSGTSGFTNSNDRRGLLITDSSASRIILENTGGTSGQRLSTIQNYNNIWSVGVLTDTGSAWNKERILGLNLGTYDATFAGDILTDSVGDKDIGSVANPFGKLYTVDADISNLISNIKTRNITPTTNNQYTIGSSSSTQYNAIYGNSIYANGTILTSDINKKKDIQPIEDALSVIMRFESKSFKFKDGTSNRTHTGFIAQQIKEVVPDDWALYCDNKLGDIGLKYTEIIPLNTRAIQQLNERLTKIENRRLVGGSIIDTSSLTEDMTQIYERLDHLSTKYLELENKPEKPQLHRCVEISRINELYDRITNLEGRLSAFDEVKDSDESELVSSLNEKVNLLILKNQELESKLERLPKVEVKNEIEDSDTGGLSMIESLQERLFKSEQLIAKQQKMITKLTSAVNKLIKSNE